jgi:hypothetical protein
MSHVGSRMMYLDPDVVPPRAVFRLNANLGVFHHVLSVPSVYGFLKLLTVVDLFITPQAMFQAFLTVRPQV